MNASSLDQEVFLAAFQAELSQVQQHDQWLNLKSRYLNKKKGKLSDLLELMKTLGPEEKPAFGQLLNHLKQVVTQALSDHPCSKPTAKTSTALLDWTLPGLPINEGSRHPLNQVLADMTAFFVHMGYDIGHGPEIENTFYNFEALNTPETHPAREDADTFYIDDQRLLRTQTSGVQIRYMEKRRPPFRMIAPGKVFRRDDDITHSPMFHQLEGLVVDRDIRFSHLKGTLAAFARSLFGPDTKIRLRPSYFPFTEPSAEVDVTCPFCTAGCRVCKGTTWIEVLGCGMVDPNVFKAVQLDPEVWTGFAFGIGIERIAMLRLGIPDIRLFYQNDVRFLKPFGKGEQ